MTRRKLSATDLRNLQTLLLASVFEPGAIGERIATARREAGLRQEDLADLIGVATRTVQNYEAGSTSAHRHIRQIAEITGTSVGWLLHGERPADEDDRINQLVGEVSEIRAMLERLLESRDDAASSEPEQAAEDS